MARLLIYDAYENKVYTYANLNENDPMPYSTGTTLRVREFQMCIRDRCLRPDGWWRCCPDRPAAPAAQAAVTVSALCR